MTPRRSYIGLVSLARILEGLCHATALPDVLNVAAPDPIAMGDLLDAAGLPWTPRPAPPSAIECVNLSTKLLEHHVPLDVISSDPKALVAEWKTATGQIPK